MKLRITLNCRMKWRTVKNGQKIIVDKGSAEPIVELVERDIEGESNWIKLHRIFDEFEEGLSKQERAEVKRLLRGWK